MKKVKARGFFVNCPSTVKNFEFINQSVTLHVLKHYSFCDNSGMIAITLNLHIVH